MLIIQPQKQMMWSVGFQVELPLSGLYECEVVVCVVTNGVF